AVKSRWMKFATKRIRRTGFGWTDGQAIALIVWLRQQCWTCVTTVDHECLQEQTPRNRGYPRRRVLGVPRGDQLAVVWLARTARQGHRSCRGTASPSP